MPVDNARPGTLSSRPPLWFSVLLKSKKSLTCDRCVCRHPALPRSQHSLRCDASHLLPAKAQAAMPHTSCPHFFPTTAWDVLHVVLAPLPTLCLPPCFAAAAAAAAAGRRHPVAGGQPGVAAVVAGGADAAGVGWLAGRPVWQQRIGAARARQHSAHG
eukprot:315189-Chlamydomonas_euryale.AAC.1